MQEKKKNYKFVNILNTNLSINKKQIKTAQSDNLLNKYYIGKKNNTFILNFKYIKYYLTKAILFCFFVLSKKGKILIINTNPELSKLTLYLKKKYKNNTIFFIESLNAKNIITNYKKIFFSIKIFIRFYKKYNTFLNKNKINFPKYKKMKKNYKGFIDNNFLNNTKNEKNLINKNLNLDLIILISNENYESVVNQAFKLNIPVICFVEKNTNIEKIFYPILNNLSSNKIIYLFFAIFCKIIKKNN